MSTIHNVKQIIIGGFIAGGVALAAMGLGIALPRSRRRLGTRVRPSRTRNR